MRYRVAVTTWLIVFAGSGHADGPQLNPASVQGSWQVVRVDLGSGATQARFVPDGAITLRIEKTGMAEIRSHGQSLVKGRLTADGKGTFQFDAEGKARTRVIGTWGSDGRRLILSFDFNGAPTSVLLHPQPPAAPADQKGRPGADNEDDKDVALPWKSVVYADRHPETGINSIKVNGYLLQQDGRPRQFAFVSLWRYHVGQKKWRRVLALSEGQPVALKPEKRAVYSRATDFELVRLPDEVGLFWAEWKEDGRRTATLVFSGPVLCNDVRIGAPPRGMIATCVPFPDRAEAMFVPDPQVHCRE